MLRYRVLRLLSWLALRVPGGVMYGGGRFVASLAYRFNARGRRVAASNVRHILGARADRRTVEAAVRGCFRATAYYYVDLCRTPLMNPRRFFRRNLRVHGIEHMQEAMAAGKGLIFATIHYGNPEYAAQCMTALGWSFFALTEPLEPPPMDDLVHRLRASQGHRFMPVSTSGIKAAIRHLRAGGIVCIVFERDIQHAGVAVPFFGATARIPSGAVDLARHTGAALIATVAHRRGNDRFDLYVEPPLTLVRTGRAEEDRRANVARLIGQFEKYLRADPSQWFVLEEAIWDDRRKPGRVAGASPRHPRALSIGHYPTDRHLPPDRPLGRSSLR